MKADFIEAGFTSYKAWYQQANFIYDDGKDFVRKFMRQGSTDSKDKELEDLVAELYDEQGDDLRNNEFFMILVQK